MTIPLLAAKFYIPAPRSDLLARPRLIRKLSEGLQNPLTLISAPAGFGKTTLLCEWHASLEGRDFPLVWLSLEEDDNDLARFLDYMIAALNTLKSGLITEAQILLQSSPLPTTKAILTALLDEASAFSIPFAFVLEDYHNITAESIHHAVAFLLSHLPAKMRLVISSRMEPPLPLSRLRVRGDLTEIRTEDLRFTRAETTEYLQRALGLDLSPQDIADLETRTEGWIAGLKLAALSLQGSPDDLGERIEEFAGSHRFIADYLVEEVLNGLPEEMHDFLMQTSITTCLHGSLCDAITEGRNGQAMLERLERENLFIVRLDDDREWFRYHHLFGELLCRRMEQVKPGHSLELHRRAARWYEEKGWTEHAVKEALAGQDFEMANRCIEQALPEAADDEDIEFLMRRLQELPENVRQALPALNHLLPAQNPLTPREREVLQLISRGASNREIAENLVVSPGTVKKHLNNIFAKLNAQNRTQAVAHAREAGLM